MLKSFNKLRLNRRFLLFFSLDGKGTKRSSPELSNPRCSRAKAVIRPSHRTAERRGSALNYDTPG